MNQLYTSLSPAIREELSKYEEHVTVPAGTALISEGVASQYVILIERGLAEISVPAGDTVVSLSVAGEGRVLGLRSVVAGVLPEIEATALEDCAISRIPRQDFLHVLKDHPEMYFAISKVLSTDLNAAERFLRQAPRVAAKSRNGTSKVESC